MMWLDGGIHMDPNLRHALIRCEMCIRDRYYSILGYSNQFQMEVADAFEVVHPDDREKIRAIVFHVIETRGSDIYQYRCIKRDGTLMHMPVSYTHLDVYKIQHISRKPALHRAK